MNAMLNAKYEMEFK